MEMPVLHGGRCWWDIGGAGQGRLFRRRAALLMFDADTRAGARRYFQIDAESIVVATLAALGREGRVAPDVAQEAFAALRIDDPTAVAGVKQEGADA